MVQGTDKNFLATSERRHRDFLEHSQISELPPKEIKDLPTGQYVVVFNNGMQEFWDISNPRVLDEKKEIIYETDEEGKQVAKRKTHYTNPEATWADPENSCDRAYFRLAADMSIDIQKGHRTIIRADRDHPIVQERVWENIPVVDWSNIHVFIQDNCAIAFRAPIGDRDYGRYIVRIGLKNTQYGKMKKMELVDKKTDEVVTEQNFEEWLKDNNLWDAWEATPRYASMQEK